MLTSDSQDKTFRQMAAFGEGRHYRDGRNAPRSYAALDRKPPKPVEPGQYRRIWIHEERRNIQTRMPFTGEPAP